MQDSIRKLAAAAVCMGAAGFAQAAIQSADWDASAHDQWLTRDTVSGLDWLDMSLTNGQTMSQVLAGDWAARGFRYATSQEVATLFEHAGVAGSGSPAGWLGTALNGQNALTFNQGTQALALIQMLGGSMPTMLDGLTGSDALGNAIPAGSLGSDLKLRAISLSAQGMDAGPWVLCNVVCTDGVGSSSASPSTVEFMLRLQLGSLLPADWKSLPGQGTSTITVQGLPFDAQTATLGSYLVRDTAAVPEPSTWALLLAGAVAVASIVWRRSR